MIVHSSLPGIVCRLYVPFGSAAPLMVTSSLTVKTVASFAPVRQTLSYGTSVPQICRFFTAGATRRGGSAPKPCLFVDLTLWLPPCPGDAVGGRSQVALCL